jgi:hypothetical protein
MKIVEEKGICCNCGRTRILNHRLMCSPCQKNPSTKKIFMATINSKCKKCNYTPKEPICGLYDLCCACCPEKTKKICSKELKLGRKAISMKLAIKTTQSILKTELTEPVYVYADVPEDFFL